MHIIGKVAKDQSKRYEKILLPLLTKLLEILLLFVKSFSYRFLKKELGFDMQSFQPAGNVTYSPSSSMAPDIVLPDIVVLSYLILKRDIV